MHHLVLKRPEPQLLPERKPQPLGGIHTAGLGLTFITRETAIVPHRNMHTHMQTRTTEPRVSVSNCLWKWELWKRLCRRGKVEAGKNRMGCLWMTHYMLASLPEAWSIHLLNSRFQVQPTLTKLPPKSAAHSHIYLSARTQVRLWNRDIIQQ